LAILKNGIKIKDMNITKTEIMQTDTSWDDAMIYFLRLAIKSAGATSVDQAKMAIESAQWVL